VNGSDAEQQHRGDREQDGERPAADGPQGDGAELLGRIEKWLDTPSPSPLTPLPPGERGTSGQFIGMHTRSSSPSAFS
jgi:hypothetical protein